MVEGNRKFEFVKLTSYVNFLCENGLRSFFNSSVIVGGSESTINRRGVIWHEESPAKLILSDHFEGQSKRYEMNLPMIQKVINC